jgi:predicted ABC-type ATPase
LKTKPQILVFAGPNGSGKSTATAGMQINGTYINADDIKTHSGCSDLEAASEAERLREYCLTEKQDFTFETVLSTDRNLALLRRAKKAGYQIKCIFVLTASAEINVFRVNSRVQEGGHDVPADKIRSRYAKSLAQIPELTELCDTLTIIDNSSDEPAVIYRRDGADEVIAPSPFWSEQKIKNLLGRA